MPSDKLRAITKNMHDALEESFIQKYPVSKNLMDSIMNVINKTYEEAYAEGEDDMRQRVIDENKEKKKKKNNT